MGKEDPHQGPLRGQIWAKQTRGGFEGVLVVRGAVIADDKRNKETYRDGTKNRHVRKIGKMGKEKKSPSRTSLAGTDRGENGSVGGGTIGRANQKSPRRELNGNGHFANQKMHWWGGSTGDMRGSWETSQTFEKQR